MPERITILALILWASSACGFLNGLDPQFRSPLLIRGADDAACEVDKDCDDDEVCDDGSCAGDRAAGGEGDSDTCAIDADCPEGTPLCDRDSQACSDAECATDIECQATAVGSERTCAGDIDCGADFRCVKATFGNAHCVLEQRSDDLACSEISDNLVEVTGTLATGGEVSFCAELFVFCDVPGRCSGGFFD